VARHLRRRCWCARQHRERLCTSVQLAGVDSWLWLRREVQLDEDLSECVTTRAQAYDTTKHNTHTTSGAAVHENTIPLGANHIKWHVRHTECELGSRWHPSRGDHFHTSPRQLTASVAGTERVDMSVQDSWAIAKKTARCAQYMGALKILWVLTTHPATFPEICNRPLFRSILRTCVQKLKFVALPVPEIIGGTQKIWVVPGYAHAPFSQKILKGFCSDGPREYICQIWSS